jgi:hypothetical protein
MSCERRILPSVLKFLHGDVLKFLPRGLTPV